MKRPRHDYRISPQGLRDKAARLGISLEPDVGTAEHEVRADQRSDDAPPAAVSTSPARDCRCGHTRNQHRPISYFKIPCERCLCPDYNPTARPKRFPETRTATAAVPTIHGKAWTV